MSYKNIKVWDYLYNVSYDRFRKVKVLSVELKEYTKHDGRECYTIYLTTDPILNTEYTVKPMISSEYKEEQWFISEKDAMEKVRFYQEYLEESMIQESSQLCKIRSDLNLNLNNPF